MGERILNPQSSSGSIAEAISGVSSAMLKLDLGLRVSTFSSNGLPVIHSRSLTRVADLRVSQHNSDRREPPAAQGGSTHADQHDGDWEEGEAFARAHTVKKIPMKRVKTKALATTARTPTTPRRRASASTSLIISAGCSPTRKPTSWVRCAAIYAVDADGRKRHRPQ